MRTIRILWLHLWLGHYKAAASSHFDNPGKGEYYTAKMREVQAKIDSLHSAGE